MHAYVLAHAMCVHACVCMCGCVCEHACICIQEGKLCLVQMGFLQVVLNFLLALRNAFVCNGCTGILRFHSKCIAGEYPNLCCTFKHQ